MKLTVVIPAYNEEAVIAKNLAKIRDFLEENFSHFEIILVDDGSSDSTRKISEKVRGVRVVSYPQNRGKGHAVRMGVIHASGDIIVFTDADLAYSPRYIADCVASLEHADIAIGTRYKFSNNCENYRASRRFASKVFIWLANFVLNLDASDVQCGIKGFKADVAKKLFPRLEISGFGFDVELLALAKNENHTIIEFPVEMNGTPSSKIRLLRDSLKMFFNVFSIKWRLW